MAHVEYHLRFMHRSRHTRIFATALAALLLLEVGAARSSEIAGTVTSARGPEAGVWVIAETHDFKTRFAKIVVTDEAGRYLSARSSAAPRTASGCAATASPTRPKSEATPGHSVNLAAVIAPDAATAAKVYPAAYWYAMMKIPEEAEVASLPGGRNGYLMWMKNMGCVGCHQLGNLATRTLPPSLGKFKSSAGGVAAAHPVRARPASQMINIVQGALAGVPDSLSCAIGPTASPPANCRPRRRARPSGIERNVVATVRDWSDDKAYLHDLSSTDRRHPTVNANGLIYGSSGAQHRQFPDARSGAQHGHRPSRRRCAMPIRRRLTTTRCCAPRRTGARSASGTAGPIAHNPMLDASGRVWYTARIRAAGNPAFCKKGSAHPSAQDFPIDSSDRQLAVYAAEERQVHLRRHLLRHAPSAILRGLERYPLDQRRP